MSNTINPVSAVLSSSLKATAREFAGVQDELEIGRREPLPRVVFGADPSFNEAKEATEELKEALDKGLCRRECLTDESALLRVSLSSPGISYPENSLGAAQSVCSIPDSETRSCVNVETRLTTSLPEVEHALQAFKLLKESPQVKTVFASIVTDQSVLNAMLDNPELKDFMQSCQTETESPFQQQTEKSEDVCDASQTEEKSGYGFWNGLKNFRNKGANMELKDFMQSCQTEQTEKSEDVCDASQTEKKSGYGFMNGLKNFRNKGANMVSDLSSYVKNNFGISSAEINSSDEIRVRLIMFFALYGVGLLIPFPSLKRILIGARLILGASGVIFTIIQADGVRQMFFPVTVPAPPKK